MQKQKTFISLLTTFSICFTIFNTTPNLSYGAESKKAVKTQSVTTAKVVKRDPKCDEVNKHPDDPLWFFNHAMFKFNKIVDTMVLKPIAKVYKFAIPEIARDGIHNVLLNLDEPLNAINSILQGRVNDAGVNLGRFAVNTTVGVVGLGDPAKSMGLPPKDNDFGKTLATWGAGEGPYLVLPLLGPSNIRDGVGTGVDVFINPVNYALNTNVNHEDRGVIKDSVMGTKTVDTRSRSLNTMDKMEKESVDFYSAMKTMYSQYRRKQVDDLLGISGSQGTVGKRSYDIEE